MEERHEAAPSSRSSSSACIRFDVRNISFRAPLAVSCDAEATILTLKHRIAEAVRNTRDAEHGWPRPEGIRCIWRGTMVADDTVLHALRADEPVVMHIVVAPDMWEAYEDPVPPPLTHSPEAAPPPAPSAEAREPEPEPKAGSADEAETDEAWRTYFEMLAPEHVEATAHALYITSRCYHMYYEKLAETCQGTMPPMPLLLVPPGIDFAPAQALWADASICRDTVEMVERQIMQWKPMKELSAEAQQASAASPVAWTYEPVEVDGLPYLLRTPSDMSTNAGLTLTMHLVERTTTLMEALMLLAQAHDHYTWSLAMPRPSSSPPRWGREDWLSLVYMYFHLLWRIGIALLLFWPHHSRMQQGLVIAATVAYLVFRGYRHMQERGRPPSTTTTSTTPAEAMASTTTANEATSSSSSAWTLELPRLPYRTPAQGHWHVESWMQRIAWLGLEEEERAMGFGHTAPQTPPRIVWETCAWPHTHAIEPRPVWHRQAVMRWVLWPVLLCLMSVIPHIEELRSDALSMRREAITALAKKWERLREAYEAAERPVPPPPALLQHPVSRMILAQAPSSS
ncbi:hypothetical protein ACI68E_002921 [Malassezia pachydermatis]|uniref:Ubiquitin-like domain-containing protein n=1 Tax=Malassezia pachydermatis TaxID=77020 RepID=A0A0M8MTK8_9BASI|nr:hypothetical protein Malapachy_3731 [Malassezia pachydermatis]KOS14074.1 hypothetical protein Malapachy_3731 [Malassezia pachydermatis]